MKAIEQKKMVVCNKKSNVQNSYWQWFKSAILLGFFCMSALTSYFCLFSFSPRSNFSASSCIIHCQSSLAFSLREPIRSFVSGHFHTTSWSDCDEIMFSGDLLQFIFRQVIDVEWLPSVCQDLLLLLSLRLFLRPLAALALQDKIDGVWFTFTWYCCSSFIKENVFPNAWWYNNNNIHF